MGCKINIFSIRHAIFFGLIMNFSAFFIGLLTFTIFSSAHAQFTDDFSDGNFHTNPSWSGDVEFFEVDTQKRLHLDAPTGSSTASVTCASTAIKNAQWQISISLDFNPSAYNYADIYLTSDNTELQEHLFGYFVRVGYSKDEISLYRQSGTRDQVIKIIDGEDGILDEDQVNVVLRITRTDNSLWSLYYSPDGLEDFTLQGTAYDSTYLGTKYFGIHCTYTKTRADKFYFDDIQVTGANYGDLTPPEVSDITAIDAHRLFLRFSEPVHADVQLIPENFLLKPTEVFATEVNFRDGHQALMLKFEEAFTDQSEYILRITHIFDPYLNGFRNLEMHFKYEKPYEANYRDVVINEIMADPNPPIMLPDAEYVEVLNTSAHVINLEGWQLQGAGNATLPHCLMDPGSYLLLTKSSDLQKFTVAGIPWGTSGALLNTGETLRLINNRGQVIDSVSYDKSWYHDSNKDDGGWSIEQIDPYRPCGGVSNWQASRDSRGGTPGEVNSVDASVPDDDPPKLLSLEPVSPSMLQLTFNEWIDRSVLLNGQFQLIPHRLASEVSYGASPNILLIRLTAPLEQDTWYQLTMSEVTDCSGNRISNYSASFYFDISPPALQEIIAVDARQLWLLFDEILDKGTASKPSNYTLTGSSMVPEEVRLIEDSIVSLRFNFTLHVGDAYQFLLNDISDTRGNQLSDYYYDFEFSYPANPNFNDLVVTEIIADPSPPVLLPEYEYIEVYNNSDRRVILTDWLLKVGQKERTLDHLILASNSYLLLCPSGAFEAFPNMDNKLKVPNWPAIINKTDTISIWDKDGALIHAVAFDNSWYRSIEKNEGGWSLEMIDPSYPCLQMVNWKASPHSSGGSPGKQNAAISQMSDSRGPRIIHALATGSQSLQVKFNERLSHNIQDVSFTMTPEVAVESIFFGNIIGDVMDIRLSESLAPGEVYTLGLNNLADCAGNPINSDYDQALVILPQQATFNDLAINEVLFHPRPGGVEFVELYNRSSKMLNLKNWRFALEKSGSYYRDKVIFHENQLVAPGDFIVLSSNPFTLKGDYPISDETSFRRFADMPPLSNTGSTIVILGDDNQIIDRLEYTEDMHHALIRDPQGVSLERIAFDAPTAEQSNWHSAASTSSGATPGMMNSHWSENLNTSIDITVEPRVFAPDQSGQINFTTIAISLDDPGIFCNMEVFDPSGRKIKKILDGALIPSRGEYQWDGTDHAGKWVSIGSYIIRIELYSDHRNPQIHKETVVVGRVF